MWNYVLWSDKTKGINTIIGWNNTSPKEHHPYAEAWR